MRIDVENLAYGKLTLANVKIYFDDSNEFPDRIYKNVNQEVLNNLFSHYDLVGAIHDLTKTIKEIKK